MADNAARREARRRRILENSENRLQKITGRIHESPINDRSNDGTNPTKSNSVNGCILPENISAEEVIKQTKYFEFQDNKSEFHEFKNFESKKQLQDHNDVVTHSNMYDEYNLKNVENTSKEKRKNCDNLKFNASSTSFSEQSNAKQLPQDIYLYNLFFSPIALVILAACLNLAVFINENFSDYTGIVMPFTMLITTQLWLGKSQDIQGSSMFIAALVLCNIKAEVVHTLKKLFTYLDMIVKNFAVYITSFIFFNWVTTIFFYNSRRIQFF